FSASSILVFAPLLQNYKSYVTAWREKSSRKAYFTRENSQILYTIANSVSSRYAVPLPVEMLCKRSQKRQSDPQPPLIRQRVQPPLSRLGITVVVPREVRFRSHFCLFSGERPQ